MIEQQKLDGMIDPLPYQKEGCYFLDNDNGEGICTKGFNGGNCVWIWEGAQCKFYNVPGGFYETRSSS